MPTYYDQILTPNATANGYVEVQNENRYALFSLSKGKQTPTGFQYITPSFDADYIAFGFDGKIFHGLNKECQNLPLPDDYEMLSIGEILEKKPFKIDSSKVYTKGMICSPKDTLVYTDLIGIYKSPFPSYIKVFKLLYSNVLEYQICPKHFFNFTSIQDKISHFKVSLISAMEIFALNRGLYEWSDKL